MFSGNQPAYEEDASVLHLKNEIFSTTKAFKLLFQNLFTEKVACVNRHFLILFYTKKNSTKTEMINICTCFLPEIDLAKETWIQKNFQPYLSNLNFTSVVLYTIRE